MSKETLLSTFAMLLSTLKMWKGVRVCGNGRRPEGVTTHFAKLFVKVY